MTVLRNVTMIYNFDHREGIDPTFDYISDLLLIALNETCGLEIHSEEVFVNSVTELPPETPEYTSLRDLYSQADPEPAPPAYTPMRALLEPTTPQADPYSRYTSR